MAQHDVALRTSERDDANQGSFFTGVSDERIDERSIVAKLELSTRHSSRSSLGRPTPLLRSSPSRALDHLLHHA